MVVVDAAPTARIPDGRYDHDMAVGTVDPIVVQKGDVARNITRCRRMHIIVRKVGAARISDAEGSSGRDGAVILIENRPAPGRTVVPDPDIMVVVDTALASGVVVWRHPQELVRAAVDPDVVERGVVPRTVACRS